MKNWFLYMLYCVSLISIIVLWDVIDIKEEKVVPVVAQVKRENEIERLALIQTTIPVTNAAIEVGADQAMPQQITEPSVPEETAKPKKQKKVKKQVKKTKTQKKNVAVKEREVLERIVEAEAGGQDLKGRILVANVILNRVKLKKYPNTIKGVVFAHEGSCYQFSPVQDGRYYTVKVSKKTKLAVSKALNGVDYSSGALFFMNRRTASAKNARWFDNRLNRLFSHGGHEFFK